MVKKSKYADNARELKKRISENNLNGIFVFFGEEKFSRDSAVNMIKEKFSGDGFEEFNICRLDGRGLSPDAISEFTSSYPLMSDKKLLIITDSEILKRADEKMTNFFDSLIKNFPDYLTVILNQESVDSRLGITKKILSASLCVEFLYKTPGEMAKWCISAFKRRGIEISPDSAYYLAGSCDPDLYSVNNEIAKLCAQCEDKKLVTNEDIDRLVKKSLQNRIFEMLDAVIMKNAKSAFKMLEDLKILNEPPIKITALLGSTLIKLYKTSVLLETGKGKSDVMSTLKLAPFIAEKYISMAHSKSAEKLGKMVENCAKYDFMAKSGQLNDWVSLELLMGDILAM